MNCVFYVKSVGLVLITGYDKVSPSSPEKKWAYRLSFQGVYYDPYYIYCLEMTSGNHSGQEQRMKSGDVV